MSKYVAARKDICAGELLKTGDFSIKVYDSNNNEVNKEELEEQGITNFHAWGGMICRGMLFNIDENGLANDLIYTTPTNYPIDGVQPKFNIRSEFIIDQYIELEELLKYLKYGVDLTQNDLNQIYRKLITHRWWLEHHMELFGWKKLDQHSYSSGGTLTIPMNVYHKLDSISLCKNGKPHREEPGFSLIKRRK